MATVPKSEIEAIKNRKIPGTNQFIDVYLVYQFLKRIILPFEKWPAFQLGIIDKNGKVLKPKSSFMTKQEKEAWGYYDIVVANLKKILAKVPGGGTRLASIAAAYFLFKEHKNFDCTNERILAEQFVKNWKTIKEEVAANNVGGGAIQFPGSTPLGKPLQDDPTAKTRKKKITQLLRRNRVAN